MDNELFIKKCKKIVNRYERDSHDLFVVWLVKAGKNNKALIGAPKSNYYYEITYIGDENVIACDIYSLNHSENISNKELS